jgi:sulfide:quinone oxidoreductase
MPLGTPIPPSPDTSAALLEAFAERGIDWHPSRTLLEIVPDRRVALLDNGTELPFDLLLAVPVHRVPQVVAESGMTEDGWIPVDPLTLRTRFPGVYAVGDVTSVGTPKAGLFAEGQAAVVAAQISARIRHNTSAPEYDGHGICYLEFGDGRVGQVDITFPPGGPPSGRLIGPSAELAADKERFGTDRVARWFGGG